jgi:hypothetical protein
MNLKLLFEGNKKGELIQTNPSFLSSQYNLSSTSPPIEIHQPDKSNQSEHNLTVSSLIVDPNVPRRHSMGTPPVSQNNPNNNTVVKSQSTTMPLPLNNTSNVTEQLLSPTINRKKSVSSKERLFSVESLNRTSSTKSNEHLIKVATSPSPKPTTILSVTTPENVNKSKKMNFPKISNCCFDLENIS